MFEAAIQTIVNYPSAIQNRIPTQTNRSLASVLTKDEIEVRAAGASDDLRNRINMLITNEIAKEPHLSGLTESMIAAAATLKSAADMLKRMPLRSPNPQVVCSVYLTNFITTCTGGPRYATAEGLLSAGFYAAGKKCPKSVERLSIEKNSQMKQRKCWLRGITVHSKHQ